MLELEDSFVDGSLVIPGQGSEEPSNGNEQNMEVMEKGTEVARKRRVPADNDPCDALADVNGDTASGKGKKQSKKQKVEKQKEQQPTGVILSTVAHDKSNEACNIAVVLKHILMLANSVTELAEKMKDAQERMEEHLKVLHVDVQHLRDRLEQHLAKEKENCPILNDGVINPAMTYTMDSSSIQPEVLAEVMLQHTSPSATHSTPRPIAAVSEKYAELSSDEIDKSKLRCIPEVLHKYPELQTDATMGVLGVKIAREALYGDDIMKQCTPKGWHDLPALSQGQLFQLKTTLCNQFPRYWSCPEAFEKKWATVQEAVAQACKRLRNLKK